MEENPVIVCARNGTQASALLARVHKLVMRTGRPVILFGVHSICTGEDPALYVRELECAARDYQARLHLLFDVHPAEAAAALDRYHAVQIITGIPQSPNGDFVRQIHTYCPSLPILAIDERPTRVCSIRRIPCYGWA